MKPEASADSEDIRGMDDTTEQHRDDIHRIVGRYRTPSERYCGTTDRCGVSGEDLLLIPKASDASMTIPRSIE
jgi:hypothetical protein